MAERKVLNKYIPPSFNPNSLARQPGQSKPGQKKVRLMAPFSMQCATCGEFIYKGKKFNARKEDAYDEEYLGIQIYRFYIRCPLCASEITFKTDPKNTDYVAEHGAQRNFEPWRDETRIHQEIKEELRLKEENNAMLALENRTLNSKREMDILDALDEMLTKNAQMEKIDSDKVLEKIHGKAAASDAQINQTRKLEEEQDEKIARSIFTDADGEKVQRISDNTVRGASVSFVEKNSILKNPTPEVKRNSFNFGIKRKRDATVCGSSKTVKKDILKAPDVNLVSLRDYASSDED